MVADHCPVKTPVREMPDGESQEIKGINSQESPSKISAPRFPLHQALVAFQPKRRGQEKSAEGEKQINADMPESSQAMERNDLCAGEVIQQDEQDRHAASAVQGWQIESVRGPGCKERDRMRALAGAGLPGRERVRRLSVVRDGQMIGSRFSPRNVRGAKRGSKESEHPII